MPGASRRGLPKCEEWVQRFNRKRTYVGAKQCGKPAVAAWYWRDVSDEPKYVCGIHDAKLNEEELKDELEREADEREDDSL